MKKSLLFSSSFSVGFDEMCFIMCNFFFSNLIHLFRSFLKTKNGPTCVVHTCVAWRVAFLFSYSAVGEHVGVCETLRDDN